MTVSSFSSIVFLVIKFEKRDDCVENNYIAQINLYMCAVSSEVLSVISMSGLVCLNIINQVSR